MFRWFTFFLLLAFNALYSQQAVVNNAFEAGEHLRFIVYYSSGIGNVIAGEAELDVKEWQEQNTGDNRSIYHIIGTGKSRSFFDWFFKVRDRFESQIDQETLLPYLFVRRTREGKYVYDDDVFFNREEGVAVSRRARKPIPEDVHDIISIFYFLRTLSLDDFEADSTYGINFYLDDSLYHSVIKYGGRERLKTRWGRVDCLKFTPKVVAGEVFSNEYPMSLWVTDDDNHLPILAESKVVVGSIKMELIEYSGLKNEAVFLEKKQRRKKE